MKAKLILISIMTLFLFSCLNNQKFTPEFTAQYTGRYFYNLDDVIEVYFDNNKLYLKWRSYSKIEPLRLKENEFFVKELNEKIQFLINPKNNIPYICLIPKEKDKKLNYNFKKMQENEEIPSTYLKNKNYKKALTAYLALQKNEGSEKFISERTFNSLGYQKLRNDQLQDAIEIFKINVALFPESANVYDSLGDAYAKNKDTLLAIESYKKTLSLDSGNRSAKRYLKKYDKQ